MEQLNSKPLIEKLQWSAWNKVCHHIDGIALGSTVHALAGRGFFDRLRVDARPLDITALANDVGARPGYFHVAMRLLASQGLVRRTTDSDGADATVSLTESGREWLRVIRAYDSIPQVIVQAMKVPEAILGRGTIDHETIDRILAFNPGDSELGQRVRLHVLGHLVAPIMKEFAVQGLFDAFNNQAGEFVQFEVLEVDETGLNMAFRVLAGQGWAIHEPGRAALTPEGVIATLMAQQYYYPVSYLPTFQMVPELLFGKQSSQLMRDPDGAERHVDRELDIRFSGLVFNRLCREPFMEVVLPMFDREPVEDQPRCVVDTGSGDGTVLVELYRAIRERTIRGKALDRYPLLMVGAEYNPVAQKATADKLASADIPHLTLFGDIGDPDALADELSRHGIDPLDELHVSKSVIHNRTYSPARNAIHKLPHPNPLPEGEGASGFGTLKVLKSVTNRYTLSTAAGQLRQPLSTGVFVTAQGELISPSDLECNLIEHFRKWIPWTRKHGMMVIEAHTVDPEITALHLGRNIITYLDASHGYSHQYLVEVEVFRTAAEAAGYRIIESRDLATHMVGQPVLSVNYLVPS